MSEKPVFTVEDISAETFGKYQYCTVDERSGLVYADSDFTVYGRPRSGALPNPWHQDTPELLAKARAMHERSAEKLARSWIPFRFRPRLACLGSNAAVVIGIALLFALLFLAGCEKMPEPTPATRTDATWKDEETGCVYLIYGDGSGSISIRYRRDGLPDCPDAR